MSITFEAVKTQLETMEMLDGYISLLPNGSLECVSSEVSSSSTLRQEIFQALNAEGLELELTEDTIICFKSALGFNFKTGAFSAAPLKLKELREFVAFFKVLRLLGTVDLPEETEMATVENMKPATPQTDEDIIKKEGAKFVCDTNIFWWMDSWYFDDAWAAGVHHDLNNLKKDCAGNAEQFLEGIQGLRNKIKNDLFSYIDNNTSGFYKVMTNENSIFANVKFIQKEIYQPLLAPVYKKLFSDVAEAKKKIQSELGDKPVSQIAFKVRKAVDIIKPTCIENLNKLLQEFEALDCNDDMRQAIVQLMLEDTKLIHPGYPEKILNANS